MVTSRIIASAEGMPPPDQAFSKVRIAAYERVGPVDKSSANFSAVASTSCAGTTKLAIPNCPATVPDIGSHSIAYQPTPGTVFFLGYGSGFTEPWSFNFTGLHRTSDGFFVKLSYLFRV